jgi:hypothetical protein
VPALLTGMAGLLMVATGCAQEGKKAAPPPTPTPMARLNTAAMQVPRIEFCKLVPESAVRDALGGKPDSATSYRNGDEEELAGVGTEVVHEIGCSWTTDGGAAARAWVFARPVDAAFARTVIASSRRTEGCRTSRGPAYGDPALTQTCRLPDGSQRVRHAGLFGQTWLTCEVAATDPAAAQGLGERSERWCVEIANALNTRR